MSSSRGKQRHEDEHEEHVNHEAWVIPYADVLTLLMALFLVLFALGRTDEENLVLAADSFRRELGGGGSGIDLGVGTGTGSLGPLAAGGIGVIEGVSTASGSAGLPDKISDPAEGGSMAGTDLQVVRPEEEVVVELDPTDFDPVDNEGEVLGDPLEFVERAVRDRAEGTGLLETIGFRRESRGLVVTIVTDKVLFAEGSAHIQHGGTEILDVVVDALADLPNAIVIEGHTDSRPISTTRFPSNWELSTARATSVLRYLVEVRNLSGDRVAAAGYADTHPIADADDPASLALNRRVEIVVLATT